MPFTAQELHNISVAALDYHIKGQPLSQHVQDKPLLAALKAKQKGFPGGKELITKRVKFDTTVDIQGYSHDDTLTYQNPANMKQASYPWYEIHGGISFSYTELKKDGISVVDSMTGKSTTTHSEAEMTRLASILEDKFDDMSEGMAAGMWRMFWEDGTQDAKEVPGVTSFVLNDPTSATVIGGLDQSAIARWRNRASLSLAATAANASTQVLVTALNQDRRQLRRYGGRPTHYFAGSDFLNQLENELRAKGNYTLTGWGDKGAIDIGVDDPQMKGQKFVYEPWLDDNSRSKYCYALQIDKEGLCLYVMDGEDMKAHAPARPENKMVFYRAVTWTGTMACWRRNGMAVYSIA